MFTPAEQTPELAGKLSEAERAGIIAWMLEGGRRALAQGRYTIPDSSAADVERWRESADSVSMFCKAKTQPAATEADRDRAGELYAAYKLWAADNKYMAVASRKFADRMALLGKGSKHCRDSERYPVTLIRTAW